MCVVGFQLTLADGTRVVAGKERVTLIVASVAFFFLTCDSVGDDISQINGLPPYKVKGIYYYAIRKIRKWMGGEKS